MMFYRLMWTHFVYYILVIRLFLSSSMNLTSHFSNFADFRQLQISNAWTKYYEISSDHTKTHHDTNHKIASLYFEFNTTFLHCRKYSDYFWTRVYKISKHQNKHHQCICTHVIYLLASWSSFVFEKTPEIVLSWMTVLCQTWEQCLPVSHTYITWYTVYQLTKTDLWVYFLLLQNRDVSGTQMLHYQYHRLHTSQESDKISLHGYIAV